MSYQLPSEVSALLKDPDLLIPAIAQDLATKEVLMLAYMNAESLAMTLSTGKATYFSRSRNELWIKGETSGNTQRVHSVSLDCDGDALLILACHTGNTSCFYRSLPATNSEVDG